MPADMTTASHLEDRFSEAADGRLDDSARRRFDDHLASCRRCANGYAEVAEVVAAVRSLPTPGMPVPVRLPAEPPRATAPWWRRLRRPAPVAGALAALAATAAVALLIHGGLPGRTGGAQTAARPTTFDSGLALVTPRAGGASIVPGIASPTQLVPLGFGNHAAVSIPGRPGAELVLATQRTTYAPGSRVDVYAGVVAVGQRSGPPPALPDQGGASPSPVVTLLTGGLTLPVTQASPQPVRGASGPEAAAPPAAASPALLSVILPADARRGEQATVIATLPAAPGQPAQTVELSVLIG